MPKTRYFMTMDFLEWDEIFGSSITLHRCRVDENGLHHPEWWHSGEWVEQKDVTYPERDQKDAIPYCPSDDYDYHGKTEKEVLEYYGYHEKTEEEAMEFIAWRQGRTPKPSWL